MFAINQGRIVDNLSRQAIQPSFWKAMTAAHGRISRNSIAALKLDTSGPAQSKLRTSGI